MSARNCDRSLPATSLIQRTARRVVASAPSSSKPIAWPSVSCASGENSQASSSGPPPFRASKTVWRTNARARQ